MSVNVLELPSKKLHTIILPNEDGGDMITMKKFMSLVAGKLSKNDKLVKLLVGDRVICEDSDGDRPVHYFLLDHSPWYAHTCTVEPHKVEPHKVLFVKIPRGRTLSVYDEVCASSIAQKVSDSEGLPVSEIRLSTASRPLRFDDNMADVPSGTTLFVNMHLLGGCAPSVGMPFADVTDKAGPTKREWNKKAPAWRQAKNGLCLEGKCTNRRCTAYGKMVIMNKGFTEMDLINDAYTCACPLCRKHVVPVACGFNNCEWKIISKIGKIGERPQMFDSDWKHAGDAYDRFSPDKNGTAYFLDIKILCKQQNDAFCAACGGRLSHNSKTANCGHIFHSNRCFNTATSDRNCIECMAKRNMTGYQKSFG